jgi:hypothetical protein
MFQGNNLNMQPQNQQFMGNMPLMMNQNNGQFMNQ